MQKGGWEWGSGKEEPTEHDAQVWEKREQRQRWLQLFKSEQFREGGYRSEQEAGKSGCGCPAPAPCRHTLPEWDTSPPPASLQLPKAGVASPDPTLSLFSEAIS